MPPGFAAKLLNKARFSNTAAAGDRREPWRKIVKFAGACVAISHWVGIWQQVCVCMGEGEGGGFEQGHVCEEFQW